MTIAPCSLLSRSLCGTFLLIALCLTLLNIPRSAEARITRLTITRRESPTFDGTSFGAAGQYEKIVGQVRGEVDPTNPLNAAIVDIALAPRTERGMVEYVADIYVLKPIEASRGNGALLYEVNNRGNKLAIGFFNSVANDNDPTTAAHAGNGFLMRQGFTLAWMGWDHTVLPGGNRMSITLPVATEKNGGPIIGPAMEEFQIDDSMTAMGALTYPAATLDTSQASLTIRAHQEDSRIAIAEDSWQYVDAQTIQLLPPGARFEQGMLYELIYPAKNPAVSGLTFAATRDFVAFLRRATADDNGNPNPVSEINVAYCFGISQGGRYQRDFIHLGFNEDEQGQRVFDGMMPHVSGAGGGFFNYRFAQPTRSSLHRRNHQYPEEIFPFAYQTLTDPITGMTDGLLQRCSATHTCPKVFDTNSGNEYWFKEASLVHTTPLGRDLREPRQVRFFQFASLQHTLFGSEPAPGICQQMTNPVAASPGYRALLVDLHEWVTRGREPPSSRVPRREDRTLVDSLPQSAIGFPDIPGVAYNGVVAYRELNDYGLSFDQGILTILPPRVVGPVYRNYVPRTDSDGNDIAGIRLPEIEVPLATYTGWALRRGGFAEGDECNQFGQFIPFAQTRAERIASGDPRLSIEERYPTHERYVREVARAARRLHRQRLLLEEDVQRYIEAAEASNIGR